MNNNHSSSQAKNYINLVLLFLLLTFIALTLYHLHKDAHVSYKPGASIEWLQPSALSKTYPQLITNRDWHFNFVNLERQLWNSKTTPSGELLITPDTLKLLEQATRLLPETHTTSESKRLSFLIEKSLPDGRGKSLGALLKQYHDYQREYRASQNEINNAQLSQQLTLLEENERQLVPRQSRYFGDDVASKLFQEKNITTHYLNQRRLVSLNKSLTSSEKAERLNALKDAYKAALNTNTDQ